jgi:hypothetical protein
MWREDNSLSRTNQVAGVADDHGVRSSNLSNGLAVVWVTEDDCAVDERGVCWRKHVCSVVYQLTTLAKIESINSLRI